MSYTWNNETPLPLEHETELSLMGIKVVNTIKVAKLLYSITF